MTNMDDSRLPVKTAKEPDRSITLLDKWKFMLALSADRRLNGTDLRCATIIADHFNVGRGYAWPSYAAISSRTGLCRRSIANSVAKLDRLGVIPVVSGGKGRANRYYPAWEVSEDDNPTEITGSDDPTRRERCIGAASDTGRESCTTPVAKDALPPSRKVHSIPLTPGASGEGGSGSPAAGGAALAGGSLRPRGGGPGKDGFEDFWNSYPKKEGHAAAKKEYAKAISAGVNAETLISKARQYAKAKAEVDAKWLKMPSNWAAGLLLVSDVLIAVNRRLVVLTARHSIPAISPDREFAIAGGLLSYGGSQVASFRQAGMFRPHSQGGQANR